MADMVYVYGATDGNGRAAARMYLERFQNKRQPSHILFGQLHRRLLESGAFEERGHISRERISRTLVIEELARFPQRSIRSNAACCARILRNTKTSLRAIERVLGVGRSTIMRILHKDMQHACHFQKVQALVADDYFKRIAFSRLYLQQRVAQPDFSIMDFIF